jgi:hypothetical protein
MTPPGKSSPPGPVAAGPQGAATPQVAAKRQGGAVRGSAPGPRSAADLPSELQPLATFIGTWRGEGRGTYPTIADFAYGEELRLRDVGRPFLVYEQWTWSLDDGRPLHAETGYWRPGPDARIELLVAEATGMVEVDEGTLEDGRVHVLSRIVASATTGPDVTSVERDLRVAGDVLRYEVRMEAVGHPLLVHLLATLQRVDDTP